MVEAGSNMSVGCPGMTRNTFVVQLEWRCRGECGGSSNSKKTMQNQDNVEEIVLLKYVKDQETSVLSNSDRIRLEMDMFALAFDPVTNKDEGKYLCLINNRPLPDAVIKLNVLGKRFYFFKAFKIYDLFFHSIHFRWNDGERDSLIGFLLFARKQARL